MKAVMTVAPEVLQKIEQFDSCSISNAIEQFHIRTRNEGFVTGPVRCMFPELTPRAGYAVTARVRTSSTPIAGHCYYDRAEWWSYVRSIPAPRFVVLEDVDHVPGLGALFGEIHSSIAVALGCRAVLTNGAVRDLPGSRQSGLQMFAGKVAVSHSYAHVVDFGESVEVGGLQIKPGNLLHGDQHGVVCIPIEIAERLPDVAAEVVESEQELIEFCKSERFSFEELKEKMQRVSRKTGIPDKELK
jgi:regulator of RNase E activity RraA